MFKGALLLGLISKSTGVRDDIAACQLFLKVESNTYLDLQTALIFAGGIFP